MPAKTAGIKPGGSGRGKVESPLSCGSPGIFYPFLTSILRGRTLAEHNWDSLGQDVYRAVARALGNEARAWDACQDAFLRSREALAKGKDGVLNPAAYLYRAAMSSAMDQGRRRKSEERALKGRLAMGSAPAASPLELMEREEAKERVWKALRGMETEERAIVTLRDIDGLSYAAIAERLDLPAGTVMSRLHRARLKLRTLLESGNDGKFGKEES